MALITPAAAAAAAAALVRLQDLNVALIKATSSQFHVVPKEKHVRSAWARLGTGGAGGDSTHRPPHTHHSHMATLPC